MFNSQVNNVIKSLLDIFVTVVVSVSVVLLIRAFIVQPFLVNGKSMEPSFSHGDYLLVDEISYRFRDPSRGDVVVFKRDDGSFYIKRVIGVYGETIAVRGGRLRVLKDGEWTVVSEQYIMPARTFGEFEVVLDDDELFVMGDNRNFSFDSRRWGPLDKDDVVGLVRFRLWPLDTAQAISAPSY